jgi:DNA processing protein
LEYSASFKLFYLTQFNGISRRKIQSYLTRDPMLERLFKLSSNDLQHTFNLPRNQSLRLYDFLNNPTFVNDAHQLFNKWNPISILDNDYPTSLLKIPDPPLIIYWKGDKTLLSSMKVSVIGSRFPSPYAQSKINLFLEPLTKLNITIVSGLAYGIDRMAHEFALTHHGPTIAVLGFGFNHIYPKEHLKYFQQISSEGLLISEYAPNVRAQKWHFPERNRIISGLSSATLIIEAAERSGTMITADQALEQGKEVFAVPDSIFLKQAQGCLKLIQEGATPLVKPEELVHWIHENASLILD